MKKLMLFFIFNSSLYAHTFTVDADIDMKQTLQDANPLGWHLEV